MSLHAPFLGWKRTSCTLLMAAMFAHPMQAQAASDDGVGVEVVGGGPVKDCGWPPVVYLNTTNSLRQPGMCTGTLIHPKVILYAAHCGTVNHFRFGKDPIEPAKIYEKETIERSGTHPDYRHVQNVEVDWAYALLKEPIKDVPVVPLSSGCELEQLIKKGMKVHFVGFSPNVRDDEARPKAEVGNYAKRHAATTITDVKKGRLVMREAGKHVCKGDSGGPLMARLARGGWRTVGITSILDGKCRDRGAYSSYSKVRKELVEWVEKESGVDVTPCYDSDGKPEPSAECDRFMAFNDDPMSPKGSWDKMCSEAPLAKVRDACGVPESGEEPEEEDKKKDEEEDKKKDEEEDKKKDEEDEEDKKKGDEEEEDKKKGDEEEDEEEEDKKKGDEEDEDKNKDEEEDEDKKKDDEEEDENNDDGGEDEGKKKKKDDEEKKDDNEAKPGKTTPSKSGGCSVAGGSGALPLGVLVLVGLAGVRTSRRSTKSLGS